MTHPTLHAPTHTDTTDQREDLVVLVDGGHGVPVEVLDERFAGGVVGGVCGGEAVEGRVVLSVAQRGRRGGEADLRNTEETSTDE